MLKRFSKMISVILLFIYIFNTLPNLSFGAVSLATPQITSPGSFVSYGDITVRWNAVPGATKYAYSVRDFTTDTKIIPAGETLPDPITTSTSFTIPSSKIVNGNQYKIYLQAFDNNGNSSLPVYFYTTVNNPPTVLSTDPANGATGVAAKKVVTINFSEPVVQGSAFGSITIRRNDNGVQVSPSDVSIATSGSAVTITRLDPEGWSPGITYTVTLPANAVKDAAGAGLASQYSFSFTAINVAPTVVSTDPTNGATGVAATKVVTINFSEPVVQGSAFGSITIRRNDNGVQVSPSDVSIATSGSAVTITRLDPEGWSPGITYTVTLPANAVKDTAGAGLASSYTFSFTAYNANTPPTVLSTDPANGATGVAATKVVTINFSEPVVQGSAFGSITIRRNDNGVQVSPSDVSIATSGSAVTITRLDPEGWSSGITYIVTLPANAVKDAAGAGLASQYSFSFTAINVAPTVVSTDPTNGATGVAATKVVTINFSEPVVQGSAFGSITIRRNDNGVQVSPSDVSIATSGSAVTIRRLDPEGWSPGITYTVNLPANAVKDTAGAGLASQYSFSFTAYNTPPIILTTDPDNGAKGVEVNKVVTINFSEPILQGSNFENILVKNQDGTSVANISKVIIGNAISIINNNAGGWNPATSYTISIPANSVTDLAGAGLASAFSFSFTTIINKPIVTMPSEGAYYAKKDGFLAKWELVTGATEYRVAMRDLTADPDENLEPTIKEVSVNQNSYFLIPESNLTEGHKYRFWVGAVPSYGGDPVGQAVIFYTLSKPQLSYPENGKKYSKADLNITWDAITGATDYKVGVRDITEDPNSTLPKLVKDISTENKTSYVLNGSLLKEGHQYRIAVAAVDGRKKDQWSNETVITILVSKPVVTLPAADGYYAKKSGLITKWNEVTGANGYKVALRDLTADPNEQYDPLFKDVSVSGTSYLIPEAKLTEGHKYRFWVGVVPSYGGDSIGQEVIFYTLAKPQISYPENDKKYNKGDLNITWGAISGATDYKVGVRDITEDPNGTMTKLINDVSTENKTSYLLSGSLLKEGHRYRLAVAAVDGRQKEQWGIETVIEINCSRPEILQPENEAFLDINDIPIKWTKVEWATKYTLAIRDITVDQQIINISTSNTDNYPVSKTRLKPRHRYKIKIGAFGGNNEYWSDDVYFNIKGDKPLDVVDFPEQISVYPTQSIKLRGIVTSSLEPIKAVKVRLKREDGVVYDKVLFQKTGLNSNRFYLENFNFHATGEFLSVPGKFTLTCLVTTEKSTDNEVGSYTLEVRDPVIEKEVRYLPYQDKVYVKAKIASEIGQVTENEWPIVWVGIYNVDTATWAYKIPDINNKIENIGLNTYEGYISGAKLPRNQRLKFMFFVDGYQDYDGITKTGDTVLKITPVPYGFWSVAYNWRTDTLEAWANPGGVEPGAILPDIYMVAYRDNDEILYEIPDNNNRITNESGSYTRSWKLWQLNLPRGNTYKFGVRVAGYDDQWDKGMLIPISIFKPAIKNGWRVTFNHVNKTVRVNAQGQGIPGNFSVHLGVLGKSSTSILSAVQNGAVADYKNDIAISTLGLSEDETYGFYLRIVDETGAEVDCTAPLYVDLTIPKPIENDRVAKAGDYLAYARAHDWFDGTSNKRYSFTQQVTATQNISNGHAYEWGWLKKIGDIFDIEHGIEQLWDQPWLSHNAFKQEILEMVRKTEESRESEILAKFNEYASPFFEVSDIELKKDTPLSKYTFSQVKTMLEKSNDPKAVKALGYLGKAETMFKGAQYANEAIGYVLIVMSSYEVNDEILNAFADVAYVLPDEPRFYSAVQDIIALNKKGKNAFKFDKLKDQLGGQLAGYTFGKLLAKGPLVVTAAITVFQVGLELGGWNDRMENIYSTLTSWFIQNDGQMAYNIYSNRQNANGIRSAGIVYLVASKTANEKYVEFLDGFWFNKYPEERQVAYPKIAQIENALPIWMSEAKLP